LIRLSVALTAATITLAIAIVALGVVGGYAAECSGEWVRASWYGVESGNRTASGKRFDGTQWLVAHRTLPFGTKLRLTYQGRSVVVPVEDRGPFVAGRSLDLSAAVAAKLGTKAHGVVRLCMERVR